MATATRAGSGLFPWIENLNWAGVDYVNGRSIDLKPKGKFLHYMVSSDLLTETGLKFHYAVEEADLPKALEIIKRKCVEYNVHQFKIVRSPLGGRQLGKDFTIYMSRGQDNPNFLRAFTNDLEAELIRHSIRPRRQVGQNLHTGDRPISGSKYGYYRFDHVDDNGNITKEYNNSYRFVAPKTGDPMDYVQIRSDYLRENSYRKANDVFCVNMYSQEEALQYQEAMRQQGVYVSLHALPDRSKYWIEAVDTPQNLEAFYRAKQQVVAAQNAASERGYRSSSETGKIFQVTMSSRMEALQYQEAMRQQGVRTTRHALPDRSKYWIEVVDTPQNRDAFYRAKQQVVAAQKAASGRGQRSSSKTGGVFCVNMSSRAEALQYQEAMRQQGVRTTRHALPDKSKYWIEAVDTPQNREAFYRAKQQVVAAQKAAFETENRTVICERQIFVVNMSSRAEAIQYQEEMKKQGVRATRHALPDRSRYWIEAEDTPQNRDAFYRAKQQITARNNFLKNKNLTRRD